MTRCAAPNIVGTIPVNTIRPASVRPKLALNAMPTSNTTTVLSATNTCDPFAIACIHTTEFAVLEADCSDTVRNRLLRSGSALNVWISAIPLTVCSSSAAIARSALQHPSHRGLDTAARDPQRDQGQRCEHKCGNRHLP